MRSLWPSIRAFLCCESGPTAVEYAVLLALILLVCLASIVLFGQATADSFTNSANSIQSATRAAGS